nr:gonadotropin-releasing hormone II, GnRH II [Clarias gariepinus=African catfish, brain, Peptide, 10 aa] [Clarias gariepinus]
EHWSHGWYPG